MMSDFPYIRGDCITPKRHWNVYKGTDTSSNRPIIWKEFNFSKSDFSLQREIRLQSRIQHRYIAPVLASKDLSTEPGRAHFVMIFEQFPYELEKESGRGLSEEKIINILGMAISALVHLQNEGIAHRDIKPDNLYLAQDWTLRVGDFGTSKECKESVLQTHQGTPLYMSPLLRQEMGNPQLQHNPYKSDVYSLGLTCLQLALGLSITKLERNLPYNSLETLPSVVARLPQSRQFKELLHQMLQYEERNRPDFFQLMYLYARSWPQKRDFFTIEPIRYCDICRNLADFLCICRDELPSFCSNCRTSHETGPGHAAVPATDIDKVKRPEDIRKLQERERITTEVKQGLKSLLQGYLEEAERRSKHYEDWITCLTALKQQEMEETIAFQTRINTLIAGIDARFAAEKLESTLVFEYWKSIVPPYAEISISDPTEYLPFGQIQLSDEKLRELEGECRPVGPLFGRNNVTVRCLQSDCVLRMLDKPNWGIDEDTAIVLVGCSAVAGCGSRASPQLCFTFSLIEGTSQLSTEGMSTQRGNTLTPHLSPAIAVRAGVLYAFGGKNSLEAEAIALLSLNSAPLRSLTFPLARGTACEHQGLIYLPGLFVLCYTIVSDNYEKFHTLQPFNFVSLLVCGEKLYAFSDRAVVERALTEKRSIQKSWEIGFLSCPAPIILGKCVFFFDRAEIKKYEL